MIPENLKSGTDVLNFHESQQKRGSTSDSYSIIQDLWKEKASQIFWPKYCVCGGGGTIALCPEGAENMPLGSQVSDLCF